MRKFVAIVVLVIFTSLYFAPVVGAVVSMSGETHICAETGKVCRNKSMCMKKPRPKKHGEEHAEGTDHMATTTSHASHEARSMGHTGEGHHADADHSKSNAPTHKSCKERLSCGGDTGVLSVVLKTFALDESLTSMAAVRPLSLSTHRHPYKDVLRFKDAPTSISERPPKTS